MSPNVPLPKSISNQREDKVMKNWNHKRQIGDDQINTQSGCFSEISWLRCDKRLFQDRTSAALSCSNINTPEEITNRVTGCERNSAGALCRFIPFRETLLRPAQELCLPSGSPSETRTCSFVRVLYKQLLIASVVVLTVGITSLILEIL